MGFLVLGGTGAMGVPTIKRLADKGFDVYVTSRKDHQSTNDKIHYIKGDAHNKEFLTVLLSERRYEAIIDFMIYDTADFRERSGLLLSTTDQYVFISSARVYAKSNVPITESSPRLLDVTEDEAYKETAEYALEKARQEDILRESGRTNWTIIRPYITYNSERLQLGAVEKEQWLYRALRGRSIVFSKDIAEKTTTLTHGDDVAAIIAGLIGNPVAEGATFHVVGSQTISWREVLQIYTEILENRLARKIPVLMEDTSDRMSHIRRNKYQVRYDRLYDRVFDNTKACSTAEKGFEFRNVKEGLNEALNEFWDGEKRFGPISWKLEAYFDRSSGECTPLAEIDGWKNKLRYLVFRYTPYLDRQYRMEEDAKGDTRR